jgi:transposase-like protein
VAKELTISDHTYYRWRREYGGIRSKQAKRLKILEKENDRLKKPVADLSLDNAILKDAAEGNFYALHDAGQQLNDRWNGTRFLSDEHVGY